MRGDGVRETLSGVAKLVLKHLAEKYGGGVVETPPVLAHPKKTPPVIASPEHKPLEVEELSAGEMLEELEELPATEGGGAPGAMAHHASPETLHAHTSSVEVPVVLDKSLFTTGTPVEIKLKLYIK
jgi:hypothetical protein